MKVRYIIKNFKTAPLEFGTVYDVMQIEGGMYRIFSDLIDDDGLFPPNYFEVVEVEPRPPEYSSDDPRIAIY